MIAGESLSRDLHDRGADANSRTLVVWLALAGLASGLSVVPLERLWFKFTGVLPSPFGVHQPAIGASLGFFIPGVIFGLALSVCLWALRVLEGWLVIALLGVVTLSYALAYFATFASEALVEAFDGYSRLPGTTSIISMFVGGALGGLALTGFALPLLHRVADVRHLTRGALLGSLFGGGLAAAGWLLVSSLGAVIWRALCALHIGACLTTASYHSPGDERFLYSLYLTWQTGMAVFLGIFVQRSRHFGSGAG